MMLADAADQFGAEVELARLLGEQVCGRNA
jgi:hypothetical protein